MNRILLCLLFVAGCSSSKPDSLPHPQTNQEAPPAEVVPIPNDPVPTPAGKPQFVLPPKDSDLPENFTIPAKGGAK